MSLSFFGLGCRPDNGAIHCVVTNPTIKPSDVANLEITRFALNLFRKPELYHLYLAGIHILNYTAVIKILWNEDSFWEVLLNLLNVTTVFWLCEKNFFSFEMPTKKYLKETEE